MYAVKAVDVRYMLLVVLLVDTALGHVRLTYPPARAYSLDFLDNVRTEGPCGMPKGEGPVTILEADTSLDVTWHQAYPHQGGYKVEILEGSEVKHQLTGGQYIGTDYPTSLSQSITLPIGYTCDSCTVRLLRQAAEWGNNYIFWSCADVSILSGAGYKENCSGNGRFKKGKCKCDKLYSGDKCQYKDDCWKNADCNNHGSCVDTDSTSYPKQQCFCEAGWFGQHCEKESSVKSLADFNPSLYQQKQLSSEYKLFYRIIQDTEEIEVVMEVESSTYVALGWRSPSSDGTCQNFPIAPNASAEPEGEPEGSGEPEPEGEGNPEGEPEGSGEPEPEGEGNPEGEPEGSGKPEPEGEGNPEGEPEGSGEPEPEGESEGNPEGEPEGSGEPEPEGESEGKPKGEPEGLGEPESEGELEGNPEGEPEESGEPEPEGEGNPEGEPEGSGETEPEGEGNPEGEPQGSGKPEPEGESEGNSEGEPEGSGKPEPEGESEGKPEGEPEGSGEPESKGESEGNPEGEPEGSGKPKPEGESEGNPEGEPEGSGEPEPEGESEGNPEGEPEVEPEGNGGSLHAMDCADIVIGMAQGDLSRVNDYYTRDRSTPRLDSFYDGGENSLTAGIGQEKNGVTTILFRKKLQATEVQDHSITDELMHVIWSQGQEYGQYQHSPDSGIEAHPASADQEFYKRDELKYHGHGDQRGVTRINFYDVADTGDTCGNEWKYPSDCTDTDCDYKAVWDFNPASDEISFTISAKQAQTQWTGIGFATDPTMNNMDVILGWMDSESNSNIFDGWVDSRYTPPRTDQSQDITGTSISYSNGILTLRATRKRDTGDDVNDVHFSDTDCYYFMYPIGGGPYGSEMVFMHSSTPVISDQMVCIKSCEATTTTPGCAWTEWIDNDNPGGSGDWETLVGHKKAGLVPMAAEPDDVECASLDESGYAEDYSCTLDGLVCKNDDQVDCFCQDYKVRYYICAADEVNCDELPKKKQKKCKKDAKKADKNADKSNSVDPCKGLKKKKKKACIEEQEPCFYLKKKQLKKCEKEESVGEWVDPCKGKKGKAKKKCQKSVCQPQEEP